MDLFGSCSYYAPRLLWWEWDRYVSFAFPRTPIGIVFRESDVRRDAAQGKNEVWVDNAREFGRGVDTLACEVDRLGIEVQRGVDDGAMILLVLRTGGIDF